MSDRQHDLRLVRYSFQVGYDADYWLPPLLKKYGDADLARPVECHLLHGALEARFAESLAHEPNESGSVAEHPTEGARLHNGVAARLDMPSVRWLNSNLLLRETVPCWDVRSYGVVTNRKNIVASILHHSFIRFGVAINSMPLCTPILFGGGAEFRIFSASARGVIVGLAPAVSLSALNANIQGFLESALIVHSHMPNSVGSLRSFDHRMVLPFKHGVRCSSIVRFTCECPYEVSGNWQPKIGHVSRLN